MKTKTLILVSLFILVLSVLDVSAMTVTPLSLGSDSQVASNPNSRETLYQNRYITGTVTITNTQGSNLTNLRLSSITTKQGLQLSDLAVNATFSATIVAPNQSVTATITARVPEKLSAVTDKFKPAAFNVADLTFAADVAGSSDSAVLPLFMQRRNFLEVKEVEICINDRCKTVGDRGEVTNIRPGDTIDMRIQVENRYSTSDREDTEINDVNIEWEIDDRDFRENDRADLSTLSADDNTEESFSFSVGDDVRAGSFTMFINTYGTDELGSAMGETQTITLKVDRKSHDLIIRRASISPQTLDCTTSRVARLTSTFTNIGKRDEKKAAVEVSNDVLKLKERVANLILDQDDSRTDTFSVKVADTAKPGTYRLDIRTFFDDTAQSDQGFVDLVVPDCTKPVVTVPDEPQPPANQPDVAAQQAAIARAQLESQIAELQAQIQAQANVQQQQQQPVRIITPTTGTQAQSYSNYLYVGILVVFVLIVVIVIITLLVRLAKPRD